MRKNRSGLPKGLCWITDRHGKRRLRFFGKGFTTYLQAPYGSADFAAEYAAAQERSEAVRKVHKPIGAERTIPGSISALVASYIELVLPLKQPGTKAARLGLLNRF